MIYNDEFVWLHFPKCAGTKVEQLFSTYFSEEVGLFQDPVGLKNDPTVAWHDSISRRKKRDPKFDLGERTVICSFRKLPSWLVSRYNYGRKVDPNLPVHHELLLEGKFLRGNGQEAHADSLVKNFLPEAILKSGKVRFVRTEFFESDFKTIFGDYLDISKIPDWEYKENVNTSKSFLPDKIKEQVHDSKRKIYEKCPKWQLIEKIAYGI